VFGSDLSQIASAPRPKLGSFCDTCVAMVYFSLRLLCRFDLAVKAISIRRRIAFEREGLSFCCLAQPSSSSGAAFVAARQGVLVMKFDPRVAR
jgi:hypothetical protein